MLHDKWFQYLGTYRDEIMGWVKEFVPHRYEMLLTMTSGDVLDRFKVERLLNEIWFEAPDCESMRTTSFMRLSDLLDGWYQVRDHGGYRCGRVD